MNFFKKTITICTVFVSAAVLFVLLGYLAVFQMHLAIINSEPDTSDWILTNESYEIKPQIKNREISFEVIETSSGKTVYTTGDHGYRQWDFKTIKIRPDNDIEIVAGDMGTQILRYYNGQWQYEH
ncbi:MAG: hypothetical protein ACI4XE_08085 [Acutalibacteraceae bacterium]